VKMSSLSFSRGVSSMAVLSGVGSWRASLAPSKTRALWHKGCMKAAFRTRGFRQSPLADVHAAAVVCGARRQGLGHWPPPHTVKGPEIGGGQYPKSSKWCARRMTPMRRVRPVEDVAQWAIVLNCFGLPLRHS